MRGTAFLLVIFAASCTCGREVSGLTDPTCTSSNPCAQSMFDRDAGKCVEAFLADGTACDAGLDCLVDTACAAGVCAGQAKSCDDQNSCTTDTCVEGQGCQHAPLTCPADDTCHIYACDPASGCYDTGQTLADGTACQLWWEPCVDDATCKAGGCDSPTADAEVPGQQRWSVDLGDAIGPLTVDDGGTSTFLGGVPHTNQRFELFEFDACGKLLWSTQIGLQLTQVLQGDGELIAEGREIGGQRQYVLGIDAATGATRWTVDLVETLADAGVDAGGCYSGLDEPLLAESNQGELYALVAGCDFVPNQLLAFSGEGRIEWIEPAPFSSARALVVDSSGNARSIGGEMQDPCSGNPILWAVSPTGQTLLADSLPAWWPYPACQGLVGYAVAAGDQELVIQASPARENGDTPIYGGIPIAVAFDGGLLGHFPLLAFTAIPANLTPLIDAVGNLLVPGILSDAGSAGLTKISPEGEPLWTASEINLGMLVLSDDGAIFGLAVGNGGGPATAAALDSTTGAVLWTSTIPISGGGGLALTPGASLLGAGGPRAIAIFAGKYRPSTTAPWSRWGGDNSNRSSAR